MSKKVGNTSFMVFHALGEFCWYTANGYEVSLSSFPGVANPENKITFKVTDGDNSEIDTVVKDTLNMVNKMFGALTGDKNISIEHLPVEGGEEVKFTVTIKKQMDIEHV